MKLKKILLTTVLPLFTSSIICSCGISAHAIKVFSNANSRPSFYKKMTFKSTDSTVKFEGLTEVWFKPNKPLFTIPQPKVIKDGYWFDYWTTDVEGQNKILPTTIISSQNYTLYPHFTAIPHIETHSWSIVDNKIVVWSNLDSGDDYIIGVDYSAQNHIFQFPEVNLTMILLLEMKQQTSVITSCLIVQLLIVLLLFLHR